MVSADVAQIHLLTHTTDNHPTLCAGLRDIIARTTTIKDLPKDIWTATAGMTCAADSSEGPQGANAGGRNRLVLPAIMAGSATLRVGWTGDRRVVVTGGARLTKQVADSAASAREGCGWHDAMLQGIAC
jgi:hypothetical protein